MQSKDNGSSLDFGFAFNDVNFSDRVLRIEIEHDDEVELDCKRTSLADRLFSCLKLGRTKKNDDEVKTIHISSPVLAAKSPFFCKLFSNGMKESQQRHATLKIHPSEETALMDLLNFMYNNTLSSKTTSSLLGVLMAADKFQVSSCITYCSRLLCDLPMTCESALQFLNLPPSVLMEDGVQSLTEAAKKYLGALDQNWFEEMLLKLSLGGIEAVLSMDDLEVTEDVVYECVLKWTRIKYPMIEERREILTTRLASLIHFERMPDEKLTEIEKCDDFDLDYAFKVVHKALHFKIESPYLDTFRPSRIYHHRPVKVLDFTIRHPPHFIVYLKLWKEECVNILASTQEVYEDFRLGEYCFRLLAQRCHSGSFGLFLGMSGEQSGSCSVACEFFSGRSKPTFQYVSKCKFTSTLTADGEPYGVRNLFGVSWTQFIAPDSIYFISGVLYLKADIEIMKP